MPSNPAPAPPRWLLPTILAIVAVGAGAYAWSRGWFSSPPSTPLDGELILAIRQPGASDISRVDQAGALPVRADGSMTAEIHFNQPAYAYLVWIDADGQLVPLY